MWPAWQYPRRLLTCIQSYYADLRLIPRSPHTLPQPRNAECTLKVGHRIFAVARVNTQAASPEIILIWDSSNVLSFPSDKEILMKSVQHHDKIAWMRASTASARLQPLHHSRSRCGLQGAQLTSDTKVQTERAQTRRCPVASPCSL